MTDAQLRKLKRRELLEILLEQAKEIEQLEQENSELKHQLEDRRIHIENVGTMAEAALSLNGVFEAADAAVSQYIENIRALETEMRGETGESTVVVESADEAAGESTVVVESADEAAGDNSEEKLVMEPVIEAKAEDEPGKTEASESTDEEKEPTDEEKESADEAAESADEAAEPAAETVETEAAETAEKAAAEDTKPSDEAKSKDIPQDSGEYNKQQNAEKTQDAGNTVSTKDTGNTASIKNIGNAANTANAGNATSTGNTANSGKNRKRKRNRRYRKI